MRSLLPQHDPNPEARAQELAAQTEAYRYNRNHYGALFADKVPRDDNYDPKYIAGSAGSEALMIASRATQSTDAWPEEPAGALGQRIAVATGHLPDSRPTDLSGYEALLPRNARPLAFNRLDDDDFFAWQQVAGATPITLRGIDALPENLPIDAEIFDRALNGTDRLDSALAEGRLFLIDYALFDGMATGQTAGLQKYLWAPLALFVRSPAGPLRTVAIQTTQRPGADSPIWTPRDGVAWKMAKTAVQTAEMNFNGVVAHFGLCHLVAEVLVCVSRRRLAPAHPLLRLLAPHFEYTLAVNETARTSLLSPGGTQDKLQSGTLEDNFRVVNKVLSELRYDAIGARAEFAARKVDSVERLPVYPFRDDGLPLADALQRWAAGYLGLYYASDDDVRNDTELRAWAAELAEGGGFHAMPALDTVQALSRFVGDLLWRITGFHAVINYAGWEYAAWAPGMPSAAFGPGPRVGATEEDWFAMLPPLSVANGMMETMNRLAGTRLNRVGEFAPGHFTDPRVQPWVDALQRELSGIEADTAARDAKRPWSFPFLKPSRVTASIHV